MPSDSAGSSQPWRTEQDIETGAARAAGGGSATAAGKNWEALSRLLWDCAGLCDPAMGEEGEVGGAVLAPAHPAHRTSAATRAALTSAAAAAAAAGPVGAGGGAAREGVSGDGSGSRLNSRVGIGEGSIWGPMSVNVGEYQERVDELLGSCAAGSTQALGFTILGRLQAASRKGMFAAGQERGAEAVSCDAKMRAAVASKEERTHEEGESEGEGEDGGGEGDGSAGNPPEPGSISGDKADLEDGRRKRR